MTDSQDLIREIQEHTSAHGGENTSTHLLVQAALALQRQADELAAIGAGGVSGPLMGQPQAMPDLTALTERGAKAWTGVDAQGLREGGAGFTAADMATASAQGFRDGAAYVAASVGSELVYQARYQKGFWQDSSRERYEYLQNPENTCAEDWETRILYTHPPTAQAEGWRDIATAPKDGTLILVNFRIKGVRAVSWDSPFHDEVTEENGVWCVDDDKNGPYGLRGYNNDGPTAPTHWTPLPPPPTSSADSRKGE